jgi:hypothetical protein
MKRIAYVFWRSTAAWAALLAVGLVLVSAISGSFTDALANVPVWLVMAFVLAAYPGGLAASAPVFAEERGWLGRSMALLVAGLSASFLAFFATNFVAPALIDASPGDVFGATHGMDIGELRASLGSAREVAEAGPSTTESWLPYNHLAFHYVRRLDGMLLPVLFAAVGLLTGYWTSAVADRGLRSLYTWGMGGFLLVATYLAGENGYELIVTRASGPVEFAGDLVLIVPGTLIVGLALPLLAQRSGSSIP